MAKAMADFNKASLKTASTRKRQSTTPSSSSSSSTPKRSSYKPGKVVCFSCQQPGHIAPQCTANRSTPSSSSSSSSSASKPAKK